MGLTDDLGQKIKGKAQQVQGNLQQSSGQGGKGGLQKVKGKITETIADFKIDAKTRKRKPVAY